MSSRAWVSREGVGVPRQLLVRLVGFARRAGITRSLCRLVHSSLANLRSFLRTNVIRGGGRLSTKVRKEVKAIASNADDERCGEIPQPDAVRLPRTGALLTDELIFRSRSEATARARTLLIAEWPTS